MRIDTASHLAESDQQHTTSALSTHESREVRVMQIEPEDSFEAVLIALHLQSEPIILLLPEQSRAFSDPSHFARLQEVCPPINVSFVIPRNRLGTLARHARQHGFAFTSSLQKAAQLLPAHEKEQAGTSQPQRAMVSPAGQMTNESSDISAVVVENEQGADRQQAATTQWPPQPVTPLPESLSSTYARAHLKRSWHEARRTHPDSGCPPAGRQCHSAPSLVLATNWTYGYNAASSDSSHIGRPSHFHQQWTA